MRTSRLPEHVDLLIAGSGAAGLCAALTSHLAGLRILVVEKSALVGGTSALSEGMAWIPCSRQARAAGVQDAPDAALRYLRATAGEHFNEARAAAYVSHAANMLAFLEDHSEVHFELVRGSMDYYTEADGALPGGRALRPGLFDGRRLGGDFARLRPPLPTTTLLGGLPIASADLPHYFALASSWPARAHVARVVGRYAADRVAGWPRGTRLGNGNALVAALWCSLRSLGVQVVTGAELVSLRVQAGRVAGAAVRVDGEEQEVASGAGVLLAGGGFPWDRTRTGSLYPHLRSGKNHVRIAPPANTGDTIRAALAAGARLDDRVANPAAWSPASLVPRPGCDPVPFPHYIDRGKPGIICVDQHGLRFTNEAQPYQDFVRDMIAACDGMPRVEVFLLADHRALRRYGLGVVPPAPGRIARHLASGYLVRAPSVQALAAALGLPTGALEATVARFNADAVHGSDPQFGRGESPYHRAAGDPSHRPNPTLGALEQSPYYALRLQPGDIGTLAGLAADAHGRVLDEAGVPIGGLYAAGNDAVSPMGGQYPAAGITIGAALTFGYLAARHAAGTAP